MSALQLNTLTPSRQRFLITNSQFPITSSSSSFSNPNNFKNLSFPLIHASKIKSLKTHKNFHSRITCIAKAAQDSEVVVKERSVSVVLLAGGQGKRMGASIPKQYLPLLGQPIALYSFKTFLNMPEVREIIVVCDPSYQDIFEGAFNNGKVDLIFALPGEERQDSVYNGFESIHVHSELVCIHDSARPLVSTEDVAKVLKDGLRIGAAVLGVPSKATIKEANSESFVVKTLDRKTLWEMQTPQVYKFSIKKHD